MDEPSTKKQRLNPEESQLEGQSHSRNITLDMAKYDEWVRKLSDEELVNIFELGVAVKESVTLTVDVNQKFMKETLSSQMEPIQQRVSDIEKEIKAQVETVKDNVRRCESTDRRFENGYTECTRSEDKRNYRHNEQR